MDTVIYVHGKGGTPQEAAHYVPLFPAQTVIGLPYPASVPKEAGAAIRAAVEDVRKGGARITLIANSIGAFYCMYAHLDTLIEKAYFISPVVDLASLITDLLRQEGATEEALRQKGAIKTAFGETLFWDVLCELRAHPIRWKAPTQILCAEHDALVELSSVRDFAKKCAAGLTVMPGGEHWFHTDAQMRFLDDWIRRC